VVVATATASARRASRWNLRGRAELTRWFHSAASWAASHQSLVGMWAHLRAASAQLLAVARARPAARRGLASAVSGTAPPGTRPRVTEQTFVLGMWFDVDEASHVAGIFVHEQIAFASNAGADDARFIVVDESRVMIQRHELWFV